MNDRSIHPPESSLSKRGLVTLGILALYFGAGYILLPMVPAGAGTGEGANVNRSIMALGLGPLLAGYMTVEFAALLVPAWRPLRVGGPAGRAKLHRASLITGMLLAAGQAFFLAAGFEGLGVVRTGGAGFRILTVITLMGATAVLVVLIRMVDRQGLGSGFSTLLLANAVPTVVVPLWNAGGAVQAGVIDVSVLFCGVLFVGVVAGAALWMFSPNCLPIQDPSQHPSLVSRPACGVVPLTFVPAVILVVIKVDELRNPAHAWTGHKPGLALIVLLSVAAALLFGFLFNRPGWIAKFWKRLPPDSPQVSPSLKAALLESMLFIAVVVLVAEWAARRVGIAYLPSALPVLLMTGILADFAREWRARQSQGGLTPVWEIHQSYAVAPALGWLKAEGIHAFAQGRHFRALLQFFGPYVPVQILVPAGQAQHAMAVMQARWPSPDS